LADAADRPVKTYSGGMRRRLDLAASIVAKPSVQFLDEPTTGLDPRTRMEMWATIRELVADGTTLLLTTQYLEEADELADYVVVMDVGKVIAEGKPEELKAKLGREMLQVRVTHLSDLPKVTSILERIGNDKPHFDDSTGEISVVAPAGIQSLLDAIRALDSEHIAIADISLRRPTLDEVFLSITGQNNN
jgi:ABC-2 type transport system ATP-binding protein